MIKQLNAMNTATGKTHMPTMKLNGNKIKISSKGDKRNKPIVNKIMPIANIIYYTKAVIPSTYAFQA
jgi:hypothetical protein